MSESQRDPVGALRGAISAAARDVHPGIPEPTLLRPPRPELGDYSTNAAMLAAPLVGSPPRDVAARLAGGVGERLGEAVDAVDVDGPCFLNLRMCERW